MHIEQHFFEVFFHCFPRNNLAIGKLEIAIWQRNKRGSWLVKGSHKCIDCCNGFG